MNLPALPFTLPPLPSRSADPLDIASHEAWFRAYAKLEQACCPADPGPEALKEEHTFRVLANAREIIAGEGFGGPLARACLLGALYHDIARFVQYRGWRTFRDGSSINHGEAGARLLEEYGPLACEPMLAKTVIQAVRLHNAYELPGDLPVDLRLVTNTVRDADKLDILRVLDENLQGPRPWLPTVIMTLPDDPGIRSDRVIACALEGRPASYGDLRSVNDFLLLLGTWTYAMVHATSRRLMLRQGHALNLLRKLPDRHYGEARDRLLEGLAAAGKA